MSNKQHPSEKGANLVLNIICAGLVVIGFWQIYQNRLEDGLINIIIGIALNVIPLSNGQLNYPNSPWWKKIIIILLCVFVLGATGTVLYLAVTS
jgi:hypothetical protein